MLRSLVGSEMCIRDRGGTDVVSRTLYVPPRRRIRTVVRGGASVVTTLTTTTVTVNVVTTNAPPRTTVRIRLRGGTYNVLDTTSVPPGGGSHTFTDVPSDTEVVLSTALTLPDGSNVGGPGDRGRTAAVAVPNWVVSTLSAQTTTLGATLVGALRDTNQLGQTPDRVSVTAQYRQGTSGPWTNAGTEITSSNAFRIPTGNIRPSGYQGQAFQARAFVGPASTQALTEFTLVTVTDVVPIGSTANPAGTTSVTVTTIVSTPVPSGTTVKTRYREDGTTNWITGPTTTVPSNGVVTTTITGLDPDTTYVVESDTDPNFGEPEVATTSTEPEAVQCTVAAVTLTRSTTVSLTVTAVLSGVPTGTTPSVTISGRGVTTSSNVGQHGFGYVVSWNLIGLTAGTSYTLTISAPGCTPRTVNFSTMEMQSVQVVYPEITSMVSFGVAWNRASATVVVDRGANSNGNPWDVTVNWSFRLLGQSWQPAGTSSVNVSGQTTGSFNLAWSSRYELRAQAVVGLTVRDTRSVFIATPAVPQSEKDLVEAAWRASGALTESVADVIRNLEGAADDLRDAANKLRVATPSLNLRAIQARFGEAEELLASARTKVEDARTAAATVDTNIVNFNAAAGFATTVLASAAAGIVLVSVGAGTPIIVSGLAVGSTLIGVSLSLGTLASIATVLGTIAGALAGVGLVVGSVVLDRQLESEADKLDAQATTLDTQAQGVRNGNEAQRDIQRKLINSWLALDRDPTP